MRTARKGPSALLLWRGDEDHARGRRRSLRRHACRSASTFRLVQRDGGANERLERLLVDRIALAKVDRTPRIALEARIEQARRIVERGALRERRLHDALVGLAGADDAVVRPGRHAAPLPFLDDVRVSLLHERAQPRERLAAPVAELFDATVDQPGRGFRMLGSALLHAVAPVIR